MRFIARLAVLGGACLLPGTAFAQAAREGNIYNGVDHQPTAGAVAPAERAAGVAPTQRREAAENRDLATMQQQLFNRVQHDVAAVPAAKNNVYGVQPGGVVQITPNAGGNGAGGAAGGGGASR